MENYYFDRLRSVSGELDAVYSVVAPDVAARPGIVVGSAPSPSFPKHDGYVVCVNGSIRAANDYYGKAADLSYLNSAIFRDSDSYAQRTRAVLQRSSTRQVIIPREHGSAADRMLPDLELGFERRVHLSKYAKRCVITQLLGHKWNGFYDHTANVSNGVFMIALTLWAGARDVTMVGFSLQDGHYYNDGLHLSRRVHVNDDVRFLSLALKRGHLISTTSEELHLRVGVPLAAA